MPLTPDQEVEYLQCLVTTTAAQYPYLRRYSIYHIQGVFWLKESENKVYSHDRKLGDYSDALRELTKMMDHLIKIEQHILPPVILEMSSISHELQTRMAQFFAFSTAFPPAKLEAIDKDNIDEHDDRSQNLP